MKFITIKCQPKLLKGLVAVMALGLLTVGIEFIPKSTTDKQAEIPEQMEPITVKPTAEVAKITIHTVQEGDTMATIAAKYTIDIDTLQGANENFGTDLHPGDQLVILPSKGVLHTTDMGDTLLRISNVYGVDVATIIHANGKSDEQLAIGEKLFIPGGKKLPQSERQLARTDTPVSRGVSSRFVWPTVGELTSPYGYRWGRLHEGIDLANDVGTVIKATRAGRVTYAGWYSGYGYAVVIEHDQGYTTLYGHLSEIIVRKSQYVKSGQAIAYMGNTGNSTGSHLHFEVRKNGVPINPYSVLP